MLDFIILLFITTPRTWSAPLKSIVLIISDAFLRRLHPSWKISRSCVSRNDDATFLCFDSDRLTSGCRRTRNGQSIYTYVCILYNIILDLMTVKTWLQSNLSQGVWLVNRKTIHIVTSVAILPLWHASPRRVRCLANMTGIRR